VAARKLSVGAVEAGDGLTALGAPIVADPIPPDIP
jgi:hypothetical protein